MTGGGIRVSAVILFSAPCGQVLGAFDKGALQQSIATRAGNGTTPSQVAIALKCESVPGQPAAASLFLTLRRLQTADGSLLQVGAYCLAMCESHSSLQSVTSCAAVSLPSLCGLSVPAGLAALHCTPSTQLDPRYQPTTPSLVCDGSHAFPSPPPWLLHTSRCCDWLGGCID
jgi:hypothetical protein